MAGVIDRVTTTDAYGATPAKGCLQNLWTGRGGGYTIANAAVFYQLQYGGLGSDYWTPEAYSGPAVGSIAAKTTGIRFRSYTPGTPAVVFASIAEGDEPLLSGQQFAGTISSSGQVVPPSLNVQVQHNGAIVSTEPTVDFEDLLSGYGLAFTVSDDAASTRVKLNVNLLKGRFSGAGAVLAGSGFTMSHPGAGQNVVNFTTPWAAVPFVLAVVDDNTASDWTILVANIGVNNFQINTTLAGVLTNPVAVNFVATPY